MYTDFNHFFTVRTINLWHIKVQLHLPHHIKTLIWELRQMDIFITGISNVRILNANESRQFQHKKRTNTSLSRHCYVTPRNAYLCNNLIHEYFPTCLWYEWITSAHLSPWMWVESRSRSLHAKIACSYCAWKPYCSLLHAIIACEAI